tara:strand:- start:99 stop:965 length:867 start_codon:yes stop_codon:yes gene_type:complete
MSLSPIFRSALTDSPALHRKARIFRALALSAGLVAAAVMAPGTADATVYQYQLNDHPNGTAGTSNYGLRLDGLFGPVKVPFTFSFDAPGTGMTLLYDDQASSVHIFGRAYGGGIVGGNWDPANLGYVDIDFTYRQKVAADGTGTIGTDTANVGVRTTGQDQNIATGNRGTITLATGAWGDDADEGDVYTLVDKAAGGFSFKFNNFSNHRLAAYPAYSGPDTFVGWGWVNHFPEGGPPEDHVAASDWLFTGTYVPPNTTTEIPEPGPLIVLGLGLAGLAAHRRRSRTTA